MLKYYQKDIHNVLNFINGFKKSKFIIGVDGAGGSGKSTFVNELAENLINTEIVRMDDFYKPEYLRKEPNAGNEIGFFFDWRKLEREVLIPFTNYSDINFQKYDWPSNTLKYRQKIPRESNIIIEGVYSIRKELADYYDLKIWIDCPSEICLARGIARDGIEIKEYWQNVWMKQEEEYAEKHKPFLYSELTVNSSN
jgi:uridine kinase